jgi:hypothetical protein
MTMRTLFSILLIMVPVQTTVSVRAEPQDVKVTAVMKGSTAIGGSQAGLLGWGYFQKLY